MAFSYNPLIAFYLYFFLTTYMGSTLETSSCSQQTILLAPVSNLMVLCIFFYLLCYIVYIIYGIVMFLLYNAIINKISEYEYTKILSSEHYQIWYKYQMW